MSLPRMLKKMTLPVEELEAMKPEHRSALLMLGLFLNEGNWLRKILVGAVLGISDSPEGQASFSLTVLMATTLAGKIFEGWNRIQKGWLHDALGDVELPVELTQLKEELAAALEIKTFVRIRNNIAFHYPEKRLDFKFLSEHIEDSDATIFMSPQGYSGDILSHLSTLVGIEPLLAINTGKDYRAALASVWQEVADISGLYFRFVSELMAAFIMITVPNFTIEDCTVADVPEADTASLRFFLYPPIDFEVAQTAPTPHPGLDPGSSSKINSSSRSGNKQVCRFAKW